MQASRLLATMILLQLRGRMSAAELAAEFEVSIRTVHRDIDRLSAAGIPVYAERGRDGGFQLHDGYRTSLTGLTDDEARFILLTGLGTVGADLGIASEIGAAQLKLAASLPPSVGTRAKASLNAFYLIRANGIVAANCPTISDWWQMPSGTKRDCRSATKAGIRWLTGHSIRSAS
jgi:predicted DNA-binding transcriptional regulator YafY